MELHEAVDVYSWHLPETCQQCYYFCPTIFCFGCKHMHNRWCVHCFERAHGNSNRVTKLDEQILSRIRQLRDPALGHRGAVQVVAGEAGGENLEPLPRGHGQQREVHEEAEP